MPVTNGVLVQIAETILQIISHIIILITLSWRLTQAQTLSVLGSAEVMINWVTTGGIRGGSNKTMLLFTGNHIMEVI